MTKADLVNEIAKAASITKAAAGRALAGFVDAVGSSLKKGEKVSLVGFGTFSIANRQARKGRNPRTGKAIKIAARKVPKFSAGKALKEKVK